MPGHLGFNFETYSGLVQAEWAMTKLETLLWAFSKGILTMVITDGTDIQTFLRGEPRKNKAPPFSFALFAPFLRDFGFNLDTSNGFVSS